MRTRLTGEMCTFAVLTCYLIHLQVPRTTRARVRRRQGQQEFAHALQNQAATTQH